MKKKLIVIIVILLVCFNIYFLYKNDIETNKYIIFDDNNLFYIKNNTLIRQNPKKIRLLNYSLSSLYSQDITYENIYFDNKNDNIELYDKSKEKINVYDFYVLTNVDYNLNVSKASFLQEIGTEEETKILDILKSNGIYTSIDAIIVSRNDAKILKDGTPAEVYSITSNSEVEGDYKFNIIFAVINNEVVVLNKKVTEQEKAYTTFTKELYMTMDIDNDSLDEIVVQNSKYSSPEDTYYCVYKYDENNNKFKLISDCKEE